MTHGLKIGLICTLFLLLAVTSWMLYRHCRRRARALRAFWALKFTAVLLELLIMSLEFPDA